MTYNGGTERQTIRRDTFRPVPFRRVSASEHELRVQLDGGIGKWVDNCYLGEPEEEQRGFYWPSLHQFHGEVVGSFGEKGPEYLFTQQLIDHAIM